MARKSRKRQRQRQLDPDADYGSDREVETRYDDDDDDIMDDDSDERPRHSRGRHMAEASWNSSNTRQRPTRNSRISQRLLTEIGVNTGSGRAFATQSTHGRQLRERPPPNINLADDIDELSQEARRDDTEDAPFNLVLSDIQPQRAAKRRKLLLRKATGPARHARHFRDESIEFEDVRRSGRTNKNQKLMKESMDDEDLYQRETDKVPDAPRVISIREIFQPVREEFKDVHAPTCDTCGGNQAATAHKGVFIYCQGCSNAYHKVCLGYRSARDHQVTKVGPDNFVLQCRRCIGLNRKKEPHAPRLDMCQACHKTGDCCAAFSERKTGRQEEKLRQENGGEDPITVVPRELINNPAKVLFRCMQCLRAWHFEHLPPLVRSHTDIPPEREQLVAQYSEDWKCKDCLEVQSKVQTIVAWRPVEREKYVVGTTYNDMDEDNIEYFLKWEKKSYAHCAWRPGAWVHGVTGAPMRKAFVKREDGANMLPKYDAQEAIPEEYLMADVILAVRYKSKGRAASKDAELARMGDIDEVQLKFAGLGYEEAVWDEPPPKEEQARFAAFEAAFHEYLNGRYFKHESQATFKERLAAFRELDYKTEVHVSKQPEAMRRGKVMDYQLEGLAWLLYKYHRGENAILADEMGLGKTVQIISLIVSLVTDQPKIWPFLVVVPNSTCPNWRREIKFWAPELRVVTYHGGKIPQKMAYEHELFPDGSRNMRAHIVVMSYDSAQHDHTRALFKSVQWAGLVVDEGQRLKNDRNLLYGALRAMRIPFRILLTGTPLQNNKRELFNLIQFIDSSKNANDLDEQYQEITAENLPKLHDMIRPYFLRRTKAGVLKFLPPMAHIIVPVTMTVVQEKLCKSIMAKNADLIRAIFSRGKLQLKERTGLNNILMQLRKCLCHPFLYSENVEDQTVDAETMRRNMIEASSKLLLLQIMLPKLKERGHRVLIFSQFLNMLDIVEDFLAGLELPFQRLDGTISSLEKQKRIDRFNAPDSQYFAFLLSTRAGGVGINLATADTVIILDPDFNPHQDIQAISRAHRIGQNKKVLCFQLMTKNSAEEKMMQIGRKKMALDHALIESMDVPEDAENDLEGILKHGAEALFSDTQQDAIHYDSASVDKLLDRSHIENTKVDPEGDAGSQFAFARVWENDVGDLADDLDVNHEPEQPLQTSVWDSILAERAAEAAAEAAREQEVLGRGGRRSKAVKYTGPTYDGLEDGVDKDGKSDDDGDFVDKHAAKEETDDEASDTAVSSDALTLKDSHGRAKKGGGLAGQGKGTKPRTPKSSKTSQLAKKKSDAQSSAAKRCMASAPPVTKQESTRSGSASEEVIFAARKLPVKDKGETGVQPSAQVLSINPEVERSSVETIPATATTSPYFVEAPPDSRERSQAEVAINGKISQSIPGSPCFCRSLVCYCVADKVHNRIHS
jgi:chromodomain-helicase-DNA-binding protein 4